MKNLSSVLVFVTLGLSLCMTSCKDSNKAPYKGCCETEALVATIGAGKIYVPNIFTPNGDGTNDVFRVYGNSGIQQVDLLIIKNNLGKELFSLSNYSPDASAPGWDGFYKEKRKEGLFKYEVEVTSVDGISQSFSGKICSFICESSKGPYISEANTPFCHFDAQHDANGGLDEDAPILEPNNCLGK